MRDWFEEMKEELDEMNFKVVDAIGAIVIATAVFVSLSFMKFCAIKFNMSTDASLWCGFGLFFLILSIVLIIEEIAHKDDVWEDEEDDEDDDVEWKLVGEDADYYYYESIDEDTNKEN